MPYVTNIQESPHNAWTLTKHVAKSVNRGLGKVDEKVYGKQTNVTVTTTQPPKLPKEEHPIRDGICAVGGAILLLVVVVIVFIGIVRGDIRKRDLISF